MSWLVVEHSRTVLRYVQLDLVAAVAWLAVVLGVLLGGVASVALRFAVGLPFLLFVPGWALVSALFPRATRLAATSDDAADGVGGATVGWGERVVLSFVSSVILVPFVGFALNFTALGVRLLPVVVAVSGVTLALTGVAVYRRAQLPAETRFGTGLASVLVALLDGPRERRSLDTALNVLLVAGLLVMAASVVYAGVRFDDAEPYTEFYVAQENATGERVAGDYPMNVTRGETQPVSLMIANHEQERVSYTVVARVVNASGDDTVGNGATVARANVTVAPGAREELTHRFQPSVSDDRLTLVYLLYRGEVPVEPSTANAYRSLYLEVNVTDATNVTGATNVTDATNVTAGGSVRAERYSLSYAVTTPES